MWLHPAGPELAGEALAMLRDCGELMLERFDTPDWILPSVAQLVEADAEAGRLYIAEEAGQVLATFAVCDQADDYFTPVQWDEPAAPALYLHRLAVRPAFQASGVGSACLRYAESVTASRGARYLRLDTLARDPRARGFYRRAGYTERGTVRTDNPLPGRSGTDLVCLEKRLSL
jgi:ribosomal protein S18 acetylase RimI-like enzyme